MNKIVFIGYMGSGKTTIAKFLAKKLHLPFEDLDQIIENEEKLTVKSIFETKGEVFFRKLEHQTLKNFIALNENFVLSLGGGTPCYANNMNLLKEKDCITIYLKASLEELYGRLTMHSNKNQRPLIANLKPDEIKEFIAKQLFERSFFYNQAKMIINVDKKSIEEIVQEIEELLI
jgi:shikimate kinase